MAHTHSRILGSVCRGRPYALWLAGVGVHVRGG